MAEADSIPDSLKVFVLGPPRSGTSITYYAMREVFGLPGWGESHVMPIFQRMFHQFFLYAKSFKNLNGNLAGELVPPDFRRHMLVYVRDFYRKHYREGRWVDKTPGAEAILGLQMIQDAFPDARVVVTRRTGVEVVQSFRRKFASGFLDACHAWSNSMSAILTVREGGGTFVEIDQFELTNEPDRVSERIANYLGYTDRTQELARFFAERRTDQRSDHDWRQRLTLDGVNWSEEEKSDFVRVCGDLMKTFQYPV